MLALSLTPHEKLIIADGAIVLTLVRIKLPEARSVHATKPAAAFCVQAARNISIDRENVFVSKRGGDASKIPPPPGLLLVTDQIRIMAETLLRKSTDPMVRTLAHLIRNVPDSKPLQ